jgi:hypothetical protein
MDHAVKRKRVFATPAPCKFAAGQLRRSSFRDLMCGLVVTHKKCALKRFYLESRKTRLDFGKVFRPANVCRKYGFYR